MLFKLHYFCMTAGANALGILLGVYMDEYTDASPVEIGLLYMLMPLVGMTFRPIICSYADRKQAHREYLIACELLTAFSFSPFIIIPYLGPEFHENYPRFCWYFLVSFKVVGDVAFGGVVSIGDSLAINYAARIGTEFGIYRIWGTVAWMTFGFVVGQLNEISFLPRYVAGFMVLIIASLVDALACYVWPKEYFEMVTLSKMKKEMEQHQLEQKKSGKQSNALTRSLMPKEVVWANAKRQLWRLVTLSCVASSSGDNKQQVGGARPVQQQANSPTLERTSNLEVSVKGAAKETTTISKRTQIQVLFLLLRRDPRIVLYLLVLVASGGAAISLSFFFMSLSDICHTENTCEFSKLGGYLQVCMAAFETLLFLKIKKVVQAIGRLNAVAIAFFLAAAKFWFYATIWRSVNPHWSLVSESVTGIIYGTFLTISVEMAHLFSTEVEHLIPELVERRVIKSDDETICERLKLSLSATMQALLASANDGLGRALAALIFGLIIDAYSYQTLWFVAATFMTGMVCAVEVANVIENCCDLNFDLNPNPEQPDTGKGLADLEAQTVSCRRAIDGDEPHLKTSLDKGMAQQSLEEQGAPGGYRPVAA